MDREELREFLHFLDDSDQTEEEKLEYLELCWNIVEEFVALGWGMHPLQQARAAREKGRVYFLPDCLPEAEKQEFEPFFPDEDESKPEDEA